MDFQLKQVLRALLFSTSESLSLKDIQAVVARYHDQAEAERENSADDVEGVPSAAAPDGQEVMAVVLEQVPALVTSSRIREAMNAIAAELEESDAVYRLVAGPNGYRFAVRPEYADWVRLLRDEPRPKKLSPAALETLAVVAYRQPITRAELEAIRGVASDSALNRLIERELVHVVGRAELPGRPIQYGTTDTFLEFCGIRALEELPASDVLSPNEISDWIRSATFPKKELSDVDMGLAQDDAEFDGAADTADAEESPGEKNRGDDTSRTA